MNIQNPIDVANLEFDTRMTELTNMQISYENHKSLSVKREIKNKLPFSVNTSIDCCISQKSPFEWKCVCRTSEAHKAFTLFASRQYRIASFPLLAN